MQLLWRWGGGFFFGFRGKGGCVFFTSDAADELKRGGHCRVLAVCERNMRWSAMMTGVY